MIVHAKGLNTYNIHPSGGSSSSSSSSSGSSQRRMETCWVSELTYSESIDSLLQLVAFITSAFINEVLFACLLESSLCFIVASASTGLASLCVVFFIHLVLNILISRAGLRAS